MRAPRLIGDHFRGDRIGWAPGPLPEDTPAIPRAPAVRTRPNAESPDIPTAEELAAQALDALNAHVEDLPKRIEVVTLTNPSPCLAVVVDLINNHCSSIYGDTSGSRRRDALKRGSRVAQVTTTILNIALIPSGTMLSPVYETPRQRHRGAPSYYEVRSTLRQPSGLQTQALEHHV